jgi:anti-sigma regulatory factor (Ser/Thr protein kinase)
MARRFVVDALHGTYRQFVPRAELLVSELATNAVLHGRTGFSVTVVALDSEVRIVVTDAGSGWPQVQKATGLDVGGRGLHIVDTLSDDWEVQRVSPSGKTVSVVLR